MALDPEANLKKQLELANVIHNLPETYNLSDAYKLAELADRLRWWVRKGGARPKRYRDLGPKVLPVLRAVLQAHESDHGKGPKNPDAARKDGFELAMLIRSPYLEN